MKGLIVISTIMATLIGIGAVTSIVITDNLDDQVTTALEYGFREGSIQGYEVGSHEGSKTGYQEGSKIGYVRAAEENPGDNGDYGAGFHFTYQPTFDEVQKILHESTKATAMEVNNYTEANGLRTAYVRCRIARETAGRTVYVYNIVAFDTVDRGFVFVRPRTHEEVKVEIGKSYSELNGFPSPAYDDTITKITIYW